MRRPIRLVGVVVPAHDEEDLLPRALASLSVAVALAGRGGPAIEVLVVADACQDSTAEIALSSNAQVVKVNFRSVGRARSAGLMTVLQRHRHVPLDQIWLASTDADSRVPPNWLLIQLAHAEAGAEVVLGTVDVDDWSDHPALVERRWRAHYLRAEGHPHVHGANVGARADAYLAVGGFAGLDRDEDVHLATALRHRNVIRTAEHPVVTSARIRSRARGGFADHLVALNPEFTGGHDAPAQRQ